MSRFQEEAMDYVNIIADGARGIHLPKVLLELNTEVWQREDGTRLLGPSDRAILHSGPEDEHYDDVFEEVLDEAVGTLGGDTWRLAINEHTGDLIAYNETALERIKQYAVEVCQDCQAMLYGLDPDPDTSEAEDAEREESLRRLAEDLGCLAEGSRVPEEFEGWNDELSDSEFSRHACDGCGTMMGGYRYCVVLVPDFTNQGA
jgi:hypothetical protein